MQVNRQVIRETENTGSAIVDRDIYYLCDSCIQDLLSFLQTSPRVGE